MLSWIVVIIILYFGFKWISIPNPAPLAMAYSLPGKWYFLKFHLMKFIINRRQQINRGNIKEENNFMNSRFGGNGRRDTVKLDKKHVLPHDKEYPVDAVFFDGSNEAGWYFTLGTAQRKNDIINLFFILRIPDVGTFVNPEIASNTNVKSIHSTNEWITESGFTVSCVVPMKIWNLRFKGDLIKSPGEIIFDTVGVMADNNAERIHAEFNLEWTNFGDYFDFDLECSPTSIAHSLAIEPWSRETFHKLKSSHQTHYEQFGFLSGFYKIGHHEFNDIRLTSMRDHTIANHRRWSDIRRYIMMIYHLIDGTCIHTSIISMPGIVFTQLEFGYIITPDKRKIPVDRVKMMLAHVGENKKIPREFFYSFEADQLQYDVNVNIIETVSFKMGMDQACQVHENMAEFNVNGLKGYGFVECEYRIKPY